MKKFSYNKNIPCEVLPSIKKVMDPLAFLVPGWCQICEVEWHPDDNEATAKARIDYHYRRATVAISPFWLDHDANDRQETLVHELLHISTLVLWYYADDELKRLLPEDECPKYRGAVIEELERRHESLTQDLAWIINNHLLKSFVAQKTTASKDTEPNS